MPGAQPEVSVYLVEDSPIIVSLLTRLLEEEAGVAVVGSSGDASRAIEEIGNRPPTVVVVDLLLSAGTGIDVLRALDRTRESIPLVLTSFGADVYRQAAHALGIRPEHFFDKGNEIPRMLETIREIAALKRPS